jgi:hypothetical protein
MGNLMKKIIHNIQTNEITEVDLNDVEKAQFELNQEIYIDRTKEFFDEAEAKAAQRQVILDRLGLTADEARLLLS